MDSATLLQDCVTIQARAFIYVGKGKAQGPHSSSACTSAGKGKAQGPHAFGKGKAQEPQRNGSSQLQHGGTPRRPCRNIDADGRTSEHPSLDSRPVMRRRRPILSPATSWTFACLLTISRSMLSGRRHTSKVSYRQPSASASTSSNENSNLQFREGGHGTAIPEPTQWRWHHHGSSSSKCHSQCGQWGSRNTDKSNS